MVYASNSKHSSYTGFFKNRPKGKYFAWLDLLITQSLPGPNSVIVMVVQPHGPNGITRWYALEKNQAISQIPGLTYSRHLVADLPRPTTWNGRAMN